MNPSLIPHLLTALAASPSSHNVTNPYAATGQATNLKEYLAALCSYPYSGHLFVGEAPGYQGCALTGIPFTSERVLNSGCHPFLVDLLPRLTVLGTTPEPTATMAWGAFAGKRGIPAFWNVFPFHPHENGHAGTNRPPASAEKAAGIPFLQTVSKILEPHTIVSVGRHAEAITKTAFPSLRHVTLPHPSYGGKAGFVSGCAALGIK